MDFGASSTPAPSMRYPSIERYPILRDYSLMHELKEGAIFDKDTGIRIFMDSEMFEELVAAIHMDLEMGRRRRWMLWPTDTSSPQTSGAKALRSSTPACLTSSANLRQRRRPNKTQLFTLMVKSASTGSGRPNRHRLYR